MFGKKTVKVEKEPSGGDTGSEPDSDHWKPVTPAKVRFTRDAIIEIVSGSEEEEEIRKEGLKPVELFFCAGSPAPPADSPDKGGVGDAGYRKPERRLLEKRDKEEELTPDTTKRRIEAALRVPESPKGSPAKAEDGDAAAAATRSLSSGPEERVESDDDGSVALSFASTARSETSDFGTNDMMTVRVRARSGGPVKRVLRVPRSTDVRFRGRRCQ